MRSLQEIWVMHILNCHALWLFALIETCIFLFLVITIKIKCLFFKFGKDFLLWTICYRRAWTDGLCCLRCCSHVFRETNSLRRTMQIVECSLLHQQAQGKVSSLIKDPDQFLWKPYIRVAWCSQPGLRRSPTLSVSSFNYSIPKMPQRRWHVIGTKYDSHPYLYLFSLFYSTLPYPHVECREYATHRPVL